MHSQSETLSDRSAWRIKGRGLILLSVSVGLNGVLSFSFQLLFNVNALKFAHFSERKMPDPCPLHSKLLKKVRASIALHHASEITFNAISAGMRGALCGREYGIHWLCRGHRLASAHCKARACSWRPGSRLGRMRPGLAWPPRRWLLSAATLPCCSGLQVSRRDGARAVVQHR